MEINPFAAPLASDPPRSGTPSAIPGFGRRLALVTLALHGPFCWLLFVEASRGYRLTWLQMWPLLPGLVPALLPGAVFLRRRTPFEFPLAALITLVMVLALVRIARLGGRWLTVALILALVISIPSSAVCYGLFRM